jgi:hypothetical protein
MIYRQLYNSKVIATTSAKVAKTRNYDTIYCLDAIEPATKYYCLQTKVSPPITSFLCIFLADPGKG